MVSWRGLNASITGTAVIVNRSTNGGATWGNPVTVRSAAAGEDFDKNWSVCDNTTSSPFFGRGYTVWDDFGHGTVLKTALPTDGAHTRTRPTQPNGPVTGAR